MFFGIHFLFGNSLGLTATEETPVGQCSLRGEGGCTPCNEVPHSGFLMSYGLLYLPGVRTVDSRNKEKKKRVDVLWLGCWEAICTVHYNRVGMDS